MVEFKPCIRCGGTKRIRLHEHSSEMIVCSVCHGSGEECYSDNELRDAISLSYPKLNDFALDWLMHLPSLDAVNRTVEYSASKVLLIGYTDLYDIYSLHVDPVIETIDNKIDTFPHQFIGIIYQEESFAYHQRGYISTTGGSCRDIHSVIV